MNLRHWLLVVPAPFLIVTGYWLANWRPSGEMDWVVLALSMAVGLVGIWSAPLREGVKIAATVFYVPFMGVMLIAGLVFLECSTGNCL